MTGQGLGAGELRFARAFIRASTWTEAVTQPANPHTYTIRGRTADPAGFDRFAGLIREHGWDGEWGGRTWTYIDVDVHSYWVIDVVLNRKPVSRVPGDHGRPTKH